MILQRLMAQKRVAPIQHLLRKRTRSITPLQAIAKLRGQQVYSKEKLLETLRNEAIRLFGRTDRLVRIQTSTIDGAGRGVFAASHLQAGTLVGTYGGTYIPPIPVCGSPEPLCGEPQLLIGVTGDYVICCEGGGWIDGQDSSLLREESGHDVVQLVNHSPQPNALVVGIPEFPAGLGVSAPSPGSPWYFSQQDASIVPIPRQVSLKSVALVTLRTVAEGEELFSDYGINPPKNWPPWYEPVQEGYLEKIISHHP